MSVMRQRILQFHEKDHNRMQSKVIAATASIIIAVAAPITLYALPSRVQAQSAQQQVNEQSQPPTNGALPAPGNFYIEMINESDVILLWNEILDFQVDEYVIMRSEDPSQKPTEYDKVPGSESSYIDNDVVVGGTYSYQIVARSQGLLDGESEIKSVIITQSNIPGEPIANSGLEQQDSGNGGAISSAEDLIAPGAENFWENLIAINMIVFGFLILAYLTIYSLVSKGNPEKKTSIQSTLQGSSIDGVKNLNWKLQSDHEHPNIVKSAKSSYYSDKKTKLQEWLGSVFKK